MNTIQPAPAVADPLRTALSFVLRRTRDIYEHSPLIYFVLDADGTIIDCNRRAQTALRRDLPSLIGASLLDLCTPESRVTLADALTRLQRPALDRDRRDGDDGQPGALDLQLQALTRPAPLFTCCTLYPVHAEDGTLVELHAMMLDTSEVHHLQQRMAQADRLASVGQLAAGVAHEINNPAAFVIANLSFLKDRTPLLQRLLHQPSHAGKDVQDFLGELPRLCDETLHGMGRIRDIVRDLQIFARGSDGTPEQIDLNALCDTVANMAWLEIRRRARLEKCYGDIPPLFGHPGKLSQVLMNLIINAAHAIPEGNQGRNKITLSTAREGAFATVSVRDTGCGIPGAIRGRIFDPFFTTKPPGQGTGLGLSVSAEIVRHHGGRIEVESEVGAGTTFTIHLPLPSSSSRPPAPPAPSPVLAPLPAATPVRGKVLLIDDEPNILSALARVLGEEHEVLLARSGQEARALLAESRHQDLDVILCDVTMPEVSGMDLYENLPRALRERVIFLSGDTGSLAARAFLESVRRPHLTKPVEPDLLRQTIRSAVSARRGLHKQAGP